MSRITDDLISDVRKYLDDDPSRGRYSVKDQFGLSEWEARVAVDKAKNTPFGPTIAVFDLETTDLSGDFGRLLCGSIMSYPSMEMKTFRYDQFASAPDDDRKLAVAVRDHIEKHHISCGYYSKGFDIPFLNTRLMVHREKPLERMLHIDAIWSYKGWRGMKIRSSKMKVVAKVLKLDERKMEVEDEVWIQARHGNKKAMDTVCDRCESDVRVTMNILVHALDNRLIKSIQTYP